MLVLFSLPSPRDMLPLASMSNHLGSPGLGHECDSRESMVRAGKMLCSLVLPCYLCSRRLGPRLGRVSQRTTAELIC